MPTTAKAESEMLHEYRAFALKHIEPVAADFEESCLLPAELIAALAENGYLRARLSTEFGGLALDMRSFGLLVSNLGRFSSSVRNLLTVHTMVTQTIERWGSSTLRTQWLPQLANGSVIGAFALTEPDSGSDFDRIATRVEVSGGKLILTGTKTWISCGTIAGLFLVFAKLAGSHVALLVPRDTPNLRVMPITERLLGARASLLATVEFNGVVLDDHYIIGKHGFGKIAVGAMALDLGRFTVAWGSLGMADACLESVLIHAKQASRFGKLISEHQLVARLITEIVLANESAAFHCKRAARLHDVGDPQAVAATYMAKYSASKALATAGKNGVQILGARGCLDCSAVARAYRDAPLMEIIEGTSELCELVIADNALHGSGLDKMRKYE